MAIVAKWKGKRSDEPGFEFLAAAPARDLDETDWHNLSEESREVVRQSPLYTVSEPRAETAEREAQAAERQQARAERQAAERQTGG